MKREDKVAVVGLAICAISVLYLSALLIHALLEPHHTEQINPTDTSSIYTEDPLTVRETTTTQVPTTTTEAPTTTTTARASRGVVRAEEITVAQDDDFWYRLAGCESGNGRTSRNQFQFSSDTAAKVGIDGSEPYEEQRAAAISWAASIHPNEGTKSGWPNCWWVALAG